VKNTAFVTIKNYYKKLLLKFLSGLKLKIWKLLLAKF